MDGAIEIHERVLANIERLPPMPETVAEVMRMSRSEEFGARDLASVVCRDQTLAARVLKLCNAGFYSLNQEVTSIQRAVLLLGFEMVKNLVFSSFVNSVIQGDFEGYAQSSESLWEHSFGAATACLALAEVAAEDLTDAAYTAGLIHDIGKVVLASFVAERFQEVLARVTSRRESFCQAEKSVLGTTHAEIGALVAERWQLAPALRRVIRSHHDPRAESTEPRLCALVSLADGICGILGVGPGLDATDATLDAWSLELLGLEGDRLQEALDQATQRVIELQGSNILS